MTQAERGDGQVRSLVETAKAHSRHGQDFSRQETSSYRIARPKVLSRVNEDASSGVECNCQVHGSGFS
jgi:hypothetical protein